MAIVGQIVEFLAANPSGLLAVFLLFVFICVLSMFFWSPKPSANPFKRDATRPPKPLVTDQAARDKVLKQGFQLKAVPDNVDAIVVGSGMGGLTTAVILAKSGKRVLVLEQHDQAGGCCHTFIEKGFEYDVGIHYIGEMRNNTAVRLLMNQVTDGQLQWVDLMDEFDVVALGETGKRRMIPICAGGAAGFKKALLAHFPKEEAALDKYLALLRETRKHVLGMMMVKSLPKWVVRLLISTGLINYLTKYFQFARRSAKEVLDELTDDADLKAVLTYNYGDYGTPPSQNSFALHATLINHYLYGGSYPRGGASEIAFSMIPIIEQTGGRVLVRAPVSQILTDTTGRAIGVRVDRGTNPVDLFAPLIISDAGVVNTFTKLLPREVAKKSSIHRLIGKQVDSGVGCMSLFVGLNGTTEELGLKAQHVWAFPSNDLSGLYEEYLKKDAEDAAASDLPMLFITFPSAKDPTWSSRFPGKSVCTVITIASWKWFSQWKEERVMKRGADYDSVKMALGRRMWDEVLNFFPHLADKVDHFEVGTPATNSYYIGSPRGEIYGLDHTKERFGSPEVMMHLRPDTEIPGLLLTGQDVVNCGLVGAMFGGMLCASTALNRDLYKDLIGLRQQLAKNK